MAIAAKLGGRDTGARGWPLRADPRRHDVTTSAMLVFAVAKVKLEADWPSYLAVQVTDTLCKDAGALGERYALRGYVHLASYLEVERRAGAADTEFSSSDDRLNIAAGRAARALARE